MLIFGRVIVSSGALNACPAQLIIVNAQSLATTSSDVIYIKFHLYMQNLEVILWILTLFWALGGFVQDYQTCCAFKAL